MGLWRGPEWDSDGGLAAGLSDDPRRDFVGGLDRSLGGGPSRCPVCGASSEAPEGKGDVAHVVVVIVWVTVVLWVMVIVKGFI